MFWMVRLKWRKVVYASGRHSDALRDPYIIYDDVDPPPQSYFAVLFFLLFFQCVWKNKMKRAEVTQEKKDTELITTTDFVPCLNRHKAVSRQWICTLFPSRIWHANCLENGEVHLLSSMRLIQDPLERHETFDLLIDEAPLQHRSAAILILFIQSIPCRELSTMQGCRLHPTNSQIDKWLLISYICFSLSLYRDRFDIAKNFTEPQRMDTNKRIAPSNDVQSHNINISPTFDGRLTEIWLSPMQSGQCCYASFQRIISNTALKITMSCHDFWEGSVYDYQHRAGQHQILAARLFSKSTNTVYQRYWWCDVGPGTKEIVVGSYGFESISGLTCVKCPQMYTLTHNFLFVLSSILQVGVVLTDWNRNVDVSIFTVHHYKNFETLCNAYTDIF